MLFHLQFHLEENCEETFVLHLKILQVLLPILHRVRLQYFSQDLEVFRASQKNQKKKKYRSF
jgi:hypothetical protein